MNTLVALALALSASTQVEIVRSLDTTASIAVHLPEAVDGPVTQELKRLVKNIVPKQYVAGQDIHYNPTTDVVVLYRESAPEDIRSERAAAAFDRERRMVFVFIGDMERLLNVKRSDPRFAVALGRAIAHEVEHARHGPGQHDSEGFFKGELTREQMLQPGFGR